MLEPRVIGRDNPRIEPSEKDNQILMERYKQREFYDTMPLLGDFLLFSDGVYHRFSHIWKDGLQTSRDGSFYLGDGHCSFSGGLDPSVPKDRIQYTDEVRIGRFWFFHNHHVTAHNGIQVVIPCRVFKTDLASDFWKKKKEVPIANATSC